MTVHTLPAVENLDLDLIAPHPRNPRRDLGDLTELVASIKTDGIRNPIHVIDGDRSIGRYIVIAGHRRRAAALAAGLTSIPAIIRHDVTTDAAALVEMAVENLLRADLTPIEEATLFEQLQLAGLKAPAIAKKTGRKRTTVDARLQLLTLPETTRDAIHGAQLSLDDAAALAEFADDPELAERLAASAGTSHFRWAVENSRQARARDKARAAKTLELQAAGVTVVDKPSDWWQRVLSAALRYVDVPGITEDTTEDEDSAARLAWHASCPHHAAYVDYGSEAVYICLDLAAHAAPADDDDHDGHDGESDRPNGAPVAGPARDIERGNATRAAEDRAAMLEQQTRDREDCDTAHAIRQAFIVEHTTNARRLTADITDELGRLWAEHVIELYAEVEPADAATYLGIQLPEEYLESPEEAADAVRAALGKRTGAQALLGTLAAVNETGLAREHQWTWHGCIKPGTAERRWLDFLTDYLGFELTAWEKARLDAADARAAELQALANAEKASAAAEQDDES